MDRKIKKKKWTVSRIALTAIGVLAVVFLFYSFIFAGKGSKLRVQAEKINISKVTYGDFREFIPIDGSVLPIKTIRLDAIEGGVIEVKYLEGGVLVNKGDTILKLANNNIVRDVINQETQAYRLINELENSKLSLRQRRFELKRTLTDLDFQIDAAKDNYVRSKQLYAEKVLSEQEFLTAERDYKQLVSQRKIEVESQTFDSLNAIRTIAQLEVNLTTTNKNREFAKKNLENLFIKAPIDGRLSAVNGEVGESIASGQNIGQIDDLNGFKVRAPINEHYISRIYEGLTGEFDFAGNTYTLVITKVYPEVTNGLFEVDMAFDSEVPEGIRRGQTLQIKLQLSEDVKATMVPRGGFYNTTGGNWLFVVDESGDFAERREIRLGRQNTRFYEVLEGLEAGEEVVVSSYDGYEDKDRLVIVGN